MTSRRPFDQSCNDHGFTFIGLLMIIITLGLVAGTFLVTTAPSIQTQRSNVTFHRAKAISTAIVKYKATNNNAAPANLDDLVTTTGSPCVVNTNVSSPTYRTMSGWCGPYLDRPVRETPTEFRTDGWNVNFTYNGVTLRSCGPDRTCGNADDLTFTDF